MDERELDILLRARRGPDACPAGLVSRIVNAAAAMPSCRDWKGELAALFILPRPATMLPVFLLAGLLLGFVAPSVQTSENFADFNYLEEVWI